MTSDQLACAISTGDHKRVVSLLDANPILATTIFETKQLSPGRVRRSTPLHLAATSGNLEIVQLLLERGAPVNARNGEGRTVLHDCFENGRDEIVAKCLLPRDDLELDVIALVCGTSKFCSALYEAAGIDAAGRLSAAIAADTVDVNDQSTGMTPLGWASFGDNVIAAELLCAAGAKVTVDCLHNAAKCGHANIIRYLIETQAADPNARERPDGPTPLHQAALQPFTDDASLAAQVLLEAGADPFAFDETGRTPRQVALDTRPPNDDEDHSDSTPEDGSSRQSDGCLKPDRQAVARLLSKWEVRAANSSL